MDWNLSKTWRLQKGVISTQGSWDRVQVIIGAGLMAGVTEAAPW